jgi:hypothetical protein
MVTTGLMPYPNSGLLPLKKSDMQATVGLLSAAAGLVLAVLLPLSGSISVGNPVLRSVSYLFSILLLACIVSALGIAGYMLAQINDTNPPFDNCVIKIKPSIVRAGFAMTTVSVVPLFIAVIVLVFMRFDFLLYSERQKTEVAKIWAFVGVAAAVYGAMIYPAMTFSTLIQRL